MSSSAAKFIYPKRDRWEIMVARSMVPGRRIVGTTFTTVFEAQYVRDKWLQEQGYELPSDSPWIDGTIPETYQEALLETLKLSNNPLPVGIEFPILDVNRSLPGDPPENSLASLVHPPLWVTVDYAMVCSDIHAPYHSRSMLSRLVATRDAVNPKARVLCLVGDLFNFESLSKHPQHEPMEGMKESLRIGRDILLWLRTFFDTIYISNGNHDERLAGKALNAYYPLEHVINGLFDDTTNPGGIIVTNNDYMVLDSSSGDPRRRWMLVHPGRYSKNGGTTPAALAQQYGCNVIAGHNHRIGMQTSQDGKWQAVDLGHMTDPPLHYYQRRRATTFARWNAGFASLNEGFVTSFSEDFTDWRPILGEQG